MAGGKWVKKVKKIIASYMVIIFLTVNCMVSHAQEGINGSSSLSQNSVQTEHQEDNSSQAKESVDDYGIAEVMLSEDAETDNEDADNSMKDIKEEPVLDNSEHEQQEETVLDNSEDDQQEETALEDSEDDQQEEAVLEDSENNTANLSVADNWESNQPEDTVSDNSLSITEDSIEADSSFYYIQGNMKENGTCFSGDIVVIPTGIEGYDYVRLGTEGEFSESVTIQEDAINKTVLLQFFNGELVTKTTEFIYSKDTIVPTIINVEGEDEKATEYYTLLASPLLKVEVADGFYIKEGDIASQQSHMGSGVDAVYVKYSGTEYCYEVEDNYASFSLPEDFSGKVEIWCVDKAGNISDIYSRIFIIDTWQPQLCIMTKKEMPSLEENEILVQMWDAGEYSLGIEEVTCFIDGVSFTPELTVEEENAESLQADNATTVEDLSLDFENRKVYSFRMTIEQEEQRLQIQITDYTGNTQNAVYQIKKEEITERYQMECPQEICLIVDPYLVNGQTEIYSPDYIFRNMNDFPVKFEISSLELIVKKDRFSDIKEPCKLQLNTDIEDNIVEEIEKLQPLQSMEKIDLQEGIMEKLVECDLKPQEGLKLCFTGTIEDATRHLWCSGDIKLKMSYRFEQIRGLIVEEIWE